MMKTVRGRATRVAAAAVVATAALAAPQLSSPASAAGCSGTFILYTGFNYTGNSQYYSTPVNNLTLNRNVASIRNYSPCTLTLKTDNGTYRVVGNGGISALGRYVYTITN
ncbi:MULTISPECIES: hypothetical protein [unclassified Actinoplanes]|uniref:hypothetical protein n=1 Tax=unclassified Actinoplanes TaxID=2626549 RepID=UPI0012BAFDE9|nr:MULTISPECIES: hypothetical protein [unclassified Actinoplanes]